MRKEHGMKKRNKLRLIFISIIISLMVISIVSIFSWVLEFIFSVFGPTGKIIIIILIIGSLLTATVYSIIKDD